MTVDPLVSAAASYLLYVVALLALAAWLRSTRPDKIPFAVAGLVAVALVGVLVKVASALWVDPRPFVVDHTRPLIAHSADNGFPSDHTALAMAVALVVLARDRLLGAVAVMLAVLLGAARVAAHVHHVPDILGGAGIGVLAAAAGLGVARLVTRRRCDLAAV